MTPRIIVGITSRADRGVQCVKGVFVTLAVLLAGKARYMPALVSGIRYLYCSRRLVERRQASCCLFLTFPVQRCLHLACGSRQLRYMMTSAQGSYGNSTFSCLLVLPSGEPQEYPKVTRQHTHRSLGSAVVEVNACASSARVPTASGLFSLSSYTLTWRPSTG